MKVVECCYVVLSELADELEVTNSALLQHLKNPKTGLGEGAVKVGAKSTNVWLLPIGSVLHFLSWAQTKSRKMSKDRIAELEADLIWQMKQLQ